MLYLDENGQFQDTHPDYAKEIEEAGESIIEDVEEDFLDNCNCVIETAEDGKWVICQDAPDLKELIQEHLEEYQNEPYFEELEEYVKDNVSSEESLCDKAEKDYIDRYDDYDPY